MPSTRTTNSAKSQNYERIIHDVQAGRFKPVYCFMGAESYYIDRLADYVVEQAVAPEQRDFNMIMLYGADAGADKIISAAKSFPMGADRLVVCVKEAQNVKDLDLLAYYLQKPQPTTVLVLCYKNGVLDRRKKLSALIEKTGELYESKKLYESQLPGFIRDYLGRKRVAIDPKAATMMADYVGTDLNRMAGELDKLVIALPENERTVRPELVEALIGVSKDFNNFELLEAIIAKDVVKANRIINYFDSNPKANPVPVTLSTLFKFFSQLMLAYYAPDRSESGVALWLGVPDWQVRRNVIPAMRVYNGRKVMQIVHEIRRADARTKGVGNPGTSAGDVMRELLFFILH